MVDFVSLREMMDLYIFIDKNQKALYFSSEEHAIDFFLIRVKFILRNETKDSSLLTDGYCEPENYSDYCVDCYLSLSGKKNELIDLNLLEKLTYIYLLGI